MKVAEVFFNDEDDTYQNPFDSFNSLSLENIGDNIEELKREFKEEDLKTE